MLHTGHVSLDTAPIYSVTDLELAAAGYAGHEL